MLVRLLAVLVLTLLVSGEAYADYVCRTAIFTTRCKCTNKADCDQMRSDNVCGTADIFCNADGSRCSCSVSRLPLRQVEPLPSVPNQ